MALHVAAEEGYGAPLTSGARAKSFVRLVRRMAGNESRSGGGRETQQRDPGYEQASACYRDHDASADVSVEGLTMTHTASPAPTLLAVRDRIDGRSPARSQASDGIHAERLDKTTPRTLPVDEQPSVAPAAVSGPSRRAMVDVAFLAGLAMAVACALVALAGIVKAVPVAPSPAQAVETPSHERSGAGRVDACKVRKSEKQVGTTLSRLEVAIDGDGRTPADWVKKNADLARKSDKGKSDEDWLHGLGNNINDSSWAKENGKVPEMHTPDDLRGVIDGVYAQYGTRKRGSDKLFSMFGKKAGKAPFDPSWQYRTTAFKDTGKKELRKVWDFSKQSWVVQEMNVFEYLDPATPYVVGNFPVGSIVQVKNDATGQTWCGPVGDLGTSKAEMSPGMAKKIGIPINSREIPKTTTTASITYLGKGSSCFPTPESVRADCERLQAEYQKQLEEERNATGSGKSPAAAAADSVAARAYAPPAETVAAPAYAPPAKAVVESAYAPPAKAVVAPAYAAPAKAVEAATRRTSTADMPAQRAAREADQARLQAESRAREADQARQDADSKAARERTRRTVDKWNGAMDQGPYQGAHQGAQGQPRGGTGGIVPNGPK
jgi:hypothetical protein